MKKALFISIVLLTCVFVSCSRRSRSTTAFHHPSTIEIDSQGSSRRAERHHGRTKSASTRMAESSVLSQGSSENVHINLPTSKNNTSLSGGQIYKNLSSAVFMVITASDNYLFQGSGFFISSSGHAVSNYHVFEGTLIGAECILTSDGSQYKVKDVLYKDKEEDIIIFQVDIPSKCNYIPFASSAPSIGDKAYAIGSPQGLENTLSEGIISQFRDNDIIQISIPIDHGSSGGALLNEQGEAIGITCGGIDDSGANLNFAININVVKRHIKQ